MTPHVSSGAFSLTVNSVLSGTHAVLTDARCTFTYNWNPESKTGSAQLIGINGSMLALTLHPSIAKERVVFRSNIQPAHYLLSGERVHLKKVILEVYTSGKRTAALFFNSKGSYVQGTEDFDIALL